MRVFVINKRNNPLMPCKPQTARKLLKEKKARVIRLDPFVIQLTISTGETTRPTTMGVDPGYKHVAISVVGIQEELFSVEIILRTDIVKLNSEKRMYRRARRYRKTWYRQPRFQNRKKPQGWLAPSIGHKENTIITLPRFVRGFQRFDKVKFKGKECFIFGRRSSGYFDLRKLTGQVIHKSAKASDLKLVQPFNTFLWEPTISFPPPKKFRGFHEINKPNSKLERSSL